MYTTVRTIIESVIDLDNGGVEHSVRIEASGELPKELALAAAVGGCNSAVCTIGDPFASNIEYEYEYEYEDDNRAET